MFDFTTEIKIFIQDEDPWAVQSFGDLIKIPKVCVRKKRKLPE